MPRSRDPHEFVPLPLAVDLPAGTPVGEFVITRKLGEGGMASVYGAEHPVIGKKAAIKVLAPALSADQVQVARFIQEARAVNAIGHPNIIDVFAFGQLPDGRAYFVMEWLAGMTLFDRLWEKKRLELDVSLDVLDQMCDALEATHDKGIVHRDLKPANVFLVPSPRGKREKVKLLDFGVAKLAQRDASEGLTVPRTLSGQVVGTPEYIAPEQARGWAVDGRTDIYALGVIAYEMVLGRRPFEAESVIDLLHMHLNAQPPPPRGYWPEIPSPLEGLLTGMLEKDPAHRPPLDEIRRVIHELRGTPEPFDFADTGPNPVGPVSPRAYLPTERELPLPPPRRRRTAWVGGTLAVMLLLGAGGFVFTITRMMRPHAPPQHIGSGPLTPIPSEPSAPTLAPVVVTPVDTGTLQVRVDAPNARLIIDGKPLPFDGKLAKLELDSGREHELQVSAPGRRKVVRQVSVEPGAILSLDLSLPHDTRSSDHRGDPDYLMDPFGR